MDESGGAADPDKTGPSVKMDKSSYRGATIHVTEEPPSMCGDLSLPGSVFAYFVTRDWGSL